MALRIVFMGTAPLACRSLEALAHAAQFEIVAVVTQPDRPKGRSLRIQPSAVKELALKLHLPIFQPEKARDEGFIDSVSGCRAGLFVVAAYGQILPASLLVLPEFGALNVHTSLLPKYRGAAPIQWSILNGDAETGVTIMRMDAGLDTGPILAQAKTEIQPSDDAGTLHDRLAEMGANLLLETIPRYLDARVVPVPQPPDGISYARKISREDGRIDWSRKSTDIWNQVRALRPSPGAFTTGGTPARVLKIWAAEPLGRERGVPGEVMEFDRGNFVVGCGEGALRIFEAQLEGGRRLKSADLIRGRTIELGQVLGRSLGSETPGSTAN